MKLIKKLSALLIAAALALSVTACGEDTAWVYNMGGKEVSSGLYIAYTMSAYSSARSHKDFDSQLDDVFKNTIEGVSFKEWVLKKAKQNCADYIAIETEFEKLGLSLSEDDTATIDQTVKSNWEYIGATYEKNSVSQSTYRKIIQNSYKSQKVFDAYFGKGGKTAVAEADVKKFFEENYAYVNIFGMALETATEGSELTDAQKKTNADLATKANSYVDSINKGTMTFNGAKDNYNASVDTDYKTEKIAADKDTKTLYKKDGTNPSEAAVKAIFTLKADAKAYVLSDDQAYYVAIRYPWAADGSDLTDDNYATALMAMKGDDYEAQIGKWSEALKVETNDKAVERYKPENIDLSTNN